MYRSSHTVMFGAAEPIASSQIAYIIISSYYVIVDG